MKANMIRLVGLCALGVAMTSAPATAQQMPRDGRPGAAQPLSAQESELQKTVAASPRNVGALLELAKLQEARGATADAKKTVMQARTADPSNIATHHALAAMLLRTGDFEEAIDALDAAAALQPANPALQHIIGTFFFEKTRDHSLAAADKIAYIHRGIAAEDRAIELNAEYLEALVYKNLLLRVQATLETDAARQQALIAQADALRNKALQLRKDMPATAAPAGGPAGPPPPPPPPPPPAPRKGGGNF
jgi:tetratricopeptide (TPR) repeat protein